MPPRPLIAGNWKMNGSSDSTKALLVALLGEIATMRPGCDVVVCPPAPLIPLACQLVRNSPIRVGGQDCHAKPKGAHTGDVSATLLAELGCAVVIVGHSERRADHGETDAQVQAKAAAALSAGLTPIICIGETEADRDAGRTETVVARQLTGSLPPGADMVNAVIAYEPVWAIGTGKTPTFADIERVHTLIRDTFARLKGSATDLRILYGGSVKGSNAADILAVPGVDGALVGGASLEAAEFWKIVSAAPARRAVTS
ncbi:MAG: triose-phosphate isomerase [Rhodospirillaceae bacterium]|nr:triose-phosphate isomerase [Rhodospirillaceae bacterium]